MDLEARITALEQRVETLESAARQSPATAKAGTKQKSLREFLNEKKPTTANDRGLCIAFYFETIKDFESFNAEDLKAGFREARIPLPKNPHDVINKNIAKGYMMDAEHGKNGKKAWVLTGTGLEVVESFGTED